MSDGSIYTIGYLAFPYGSKVESALDCRPEDIVEHKQDDNDLPLVEHVLREQIHARERRLASEREEGMKGDVEWVKCGGTLRDETGKRDFARTHKIRAELELRDREMLLLERWAANEQRWDGVMLCSSDVLAFSDIPWPITEPPSSVHDLTSQAISSFVLGPLSCPKVNVRDQIRHLLLRFHPDKMSRVLCRVSEHDQPEVKEGFHVVFICLKALQDVVKLDLSH